MFVLLTIITWSFVRMVLASRPFPFARIFVLGYFSCWCRRLVWRVLHFDSWLLEIEKSGCGVPLRLGQYDESIPGQTLHSSVFCFSAYLSRFWIQTKHRKLYARDGYGQLRNCGYLLWVRPFRRCVFWFPTREFLLKTQYRMWSQPFNVAPFRTVVDVVLVSMHARKQKCVWNC